jgi:hypothetical protein
MWREAWQAGEGCYYSPLEWQAASGADAAGTTGMMVD